MIEFHLNYVTDLEKCLVFVIFFFLSIIFYRGVVVITEHQYRCVVSMRGEEEKIDKTYGKLFSDRLEHVYHLFLNESRFLILVLFAFQV